MPIGAASHPRKPSAVFHTRGISSGAVALNGQIKGDSELIVETKPSAWQFLDGFCPFSSRMTQSHKT